MQRNKAKNRIKSNQMEHSNYEPDKELGANEEISKFLKAKAKIL